MRRMLIMGLLGACRREEPIYECEVPTDCDAAEFCSPEGDCEAALEREWEVVVEGASAASMHPAGGSWDEDGSPPDLYAEFGLDEGDGCVTSVASDVYEPFWNEACTFYIPADPLLLVNLWDVDQADQEEFVAGYYWEGDDAFVSLARDWGQPLAFTDETQTVTLEISVWPIF